MHRVMRKAVMCLVLTIGPTTADDARKPAAPKPLMPSLAACLSRKPVPLDERLNALVTPYAVEENPKENEGYASGEGNQFEYNWGVGNGPRVERQSDGIDLPKAKPPLPGSTTLKSGVPAGTQWIYLDAWHVTQSFQTDRRKTDSKFAPEISQDGKRAVADLGIAAEGAAGSATSLWQLVRSPERVCIVPDKPDNYSVWYAYSEVYAPDDMEVWWIFGSDDWGKCWINGKVVYGSGVTPKPWYPDNGSLKVQLKKGYNPVFFKLENAWGRTGFSACIYVGDLE
jgi:hypothetical protein